MLRGCDLESGGDGVGEKEKEKESYGNKKKEFNCVCVYVLACTYYILVVFELKTKRNQTCVYFSHFSWEGFPCSLRHVRVPGVSG